jgi:ribulose-phosphate 3-epimerase
MVTICPTVTATGEREYKQQLAQIVPFATRMHIDVADGIFTPRPLIALDKVYWPDNVLIDLHVMYREPFNHVELIKKLHPNLVIVHAEAEGDFMAFAKDIHQAGMKVGVALLPKTPVSVIKGGLNVIDHVMVFSGHLSQFGGKADLSLLDKVQELRQLRDNLEIGWDGGISEQNAALIAGAGTNVLNVGGHIHQAPDPMKAYNDLEAAAQNN